MRLIITAKGWAIAVGLAIVGAVFLSNYLAKRPPSPPDPPEPCRSSAEIIDYANAIRRCPPGADLEVYPAAGDKALVKCVCRGSAK